MNLLLSLALAAPAHAWTADEPWRTVETDHYRIHYPLDTEDWALDLASRIDPMRERVAEVVGWAPDLPTEIVILDPRSRANGFALPFARAPRIGVFPTAAPASSGIGNYRLWAEDLLVHEDAHILHLSRPSRNPLESLVFDKLLGVPAIAIKSPAWVTEGYATLVEGILTGAGRPNSDARATFLRMLATEGQLPTYGQLNGSSRWRGRSMRYLVGSAYLEWLAANHGPERLPELWARMTARERRTFNEAFEGTFGAPPAELYGRFVAELSAGALAAEPEPDQSEAFLDLSGELEPPSVSPDGTRIAVVAKGSGKQSRYEIVVRSVAVDEDAVTRRSERLAELLSADPQDVAPVEKRTRPHETVATLSSPLLRPESPRWIDDQHLLFSAWVSDSHGIRQPDLYIWDIETRRARRVTRAANLREAEPCGDDAVAVRRQYGESYLVRVSLDTGAVTPLTAGHPTIVEANPRVDDACTTVAWLRHEHEWQLMSAPIDQLDGSDPATDLAVPLPDGGQVLSVDLHPDGSALTATIGTAGYLDLWTRPVDGSVDWTRRTRQVGGAFDPDVTAAGDIYFLTTDPKGFDVRRLPADAAPVPPPAPPDHPYIRGVIRPPPVADAPPLPTGEAPTPQPYGLGSQRLQPLLSAQESRGMVTNELGLLLGDPIGRSELFVLAGTWSPRESPNERPSIQDHLGARLSWTHRRFGVHTTLDTWWLQFDDQAVGGAATGHVHRRWHTGRFDAQLGVFGEGRTDGSQAATTGRFTLRQWTALGPTVGGLQLQARGRVGFMPEAPTLGDSALHLYIQQSAWSTRITGQLAGAATEQLMVGDLQPGLQPAVRTMGTLWWPSVAGRIAPNATGARRVRAEARALDRVAGLFGEYVSVDCGANACTALEQAWVLGADARATFDGQPMATIPAISLATGLSCVASNSTGAFDIAQCADWDAYALWLTLRIQPGIPPAYPSELVR